MSTLDQIRESIEAQIADLRQEISALRAARAALQGTSPRASKFANANGDAVAVAHTPRRGPGRPKPAGGGRRVEVPLAGKLAAMLRESEDGLSAITISKRANAAYGPVLGLLRELESQGHVRRTGTRRTSLWRLITDEEKIAVRAAELEALSPGRAPAATATQTSDGVAVGSFGSRSRASSDSQ